MKRLTLLLVLAGVMMLAMNRCLRVENPYDNENNELSIEDAKIFFENFGEKLYLEKENDETATRGGSKRVSPRIMWDRGLEFRQGGKAKVEAPVEVMAAMVVKVKDPVTGEETVRRYLNCSVRIVAEKTPEGEIVYKTACMIGDMKYLSDRIRVLGERDRREGVKKRHLMTMSEMGDFTGKLLWFDTDGNFLNGETWLKGRVSATFDQYGQAFNTTSATRSSYDGSVSQDDPQTVQLAYYYDPCSGGGGGTNPPTDPDPPVQPSAYKQKINNYSNTLKNKLGDKIKNLKNKLEIKTDNNPFSETNTANVSGDDNFIFDSTKDLWIYIPDGLTDIQLKIVLAHEFGHLELLEISRNAGSMFQLYTANQALWILMNGSDDFNYSHHKYMAETVSASEQRLRDAFPNEGEMFYKAGKWAGGLMNSVGFSELPQQEQINIKKYLIENGLFKE